MTATLRNIFKSDMSRRFDIIARDIRISINDNDFFGLKNKQNKALTQSQGKHLTIDEKVSLFILWLERQININVFGDKKNPGIGKWMDTYIDDAFTRGLKNGFVGLKQADYADENDAEPSLSRKTKSTKKYLASLALLKIKAREELRGVASVTVQQITRVIIDDISANRTAEFITKDVINRLNKIGKKRAKDVANTEVIREYNHAKLDLWAEAGITLVGVTAEWVTAEDDKVCQFCDDMSGSLYNITEAYILIPAHVGCRCTWRIASAFEIDEFLQAA